MRAAIMRGGEIISDTLPDPMPGDGQVLVKTLACGICGSDLHALRHADEMTALAREAASPFFSMDLERDVVMGHEFCAEIVEFGPGTSQTLKKGDRVCSLPVVFHQGGVAGIGYSNDFPGGYGELMVLSEATLLRVSDDFSTELAALTEPMAVGIHAVAKANLQPADVPLVVGCGPVVSPSSPPSGWRAGSPSSPRTSRPNAAVWRSTSALTWWSTRCNSPPSRPGARRPETDPPSSSNASGCPG
jgi:threonine dehydrogenase-like Zn-dependent dehydrogenase